MPLNWTSARPCIFFAAHRGSVCLARADCRTLASAAKYLPCGWHVRSNEVGLTAERLRCQWCERSPGLQCFVSCPATWRGQSVWDIACGIAYLLTYLLTCTITICISMAITHGNLGYLGPRSAFSTCCKTKFLGFPNGRISFLSAQQVSKDYRKLILSTIGLPKEEPLVLICRISNASTLTVTLAITQLYTCQSKAVWFKLTVTETDSFR